MNNSEFDAIKKYFTFKDERRDVLLAGGDDCAIVSVPENKRLLVTTDTLISGVHFPEGATPEDIAYKALMVNLSDLAAMGAAPAWVTLAITLPEIDESWLSVFSRQFSEILSEFNISLIGGDTTKGALSITIQAMGLADAGKILRRDQAKIGDRIFVTGCIGDAAIGLHALSANLDDDRLTACVERLNRPQVRIRFAEELTQSSACAIDISDGLAADLGHIVEASQCGARIDLPKVPLSSSALYYFERYHKNSIDWSMVLTQGDDYELCFTVAVDDESAISALAMKHQLPISCIGEITGSDHVDFVDENNRSTSFTSSGYKHF